MNRHAHAAGLGLAVPALLLALAQGARAHDFYGDVKVRGFPCCGGSGPNADCEPLETDQIKVGREVKVYSKRYSAWIEVNPDKVQWMLLPQDPLARPGHYCGIPRASSSFWLKATPDDPDPVYHSYCVFITPGGS